MKLPKLHLNSKGFSSMVILVLVVLVILIGLGIFVLLKNNTASRQQPNDNPTTSAQPEKATSISPAIQALLGKKLDLVEELAKNPKLVPALEASSVKNSKLSPQQIKDLDDRWKESKGDSKFITPFLTNEVALILTEFQETHPEFPEVFATDQVGLNVGQTNKTSDYYQADEDWWVKAYNKGLGQSYYGELEYDESAQSESIALYVPVFNAKREVVGVIKAVLAISAIQREL